MFEVPAASPFTTPDTGLMMATDVELLVQVPPAVALVNVVEPPAQTASVPPILAGNGLIVIGLVVKQPVAKV